MTATQFRAALEHLGWTQQQMANELKISIRSVNGYANGTPIPKLVELAILALNKEQTK